MKYAIARKNFDLVIVNSIRSRQALIKIMSGQKWNYTLDYDHYNLSNDKLPNIVLTLSPEDFISTFKIVEVKDETLA